MSALAKAAKHSAPSHYLGFALQPVRFCYHLLTCAKGAKVHDGLRLNVTISLRRTGSPASSTRT